MNTSCTVLAQLFDFISKYEFDKSVNKYQGNYKSQAFSCWEQYVVMSFAQLTYRESLRDIESFLQAVYSKLYHCGTFYGTAQNAVYIQIWIALSVYLYSGNYEKKIEIGTIALQYSTNIDHNTF